MRYIVSTSFLTLMSLIFILFPVPAQKFISHSLDIPVQSEETFQGKIIISEIMFDPDPSQGLPDSEYIELFNRSDEDLSLNNWSINDIQITELSLGSKQYVVLCQKENAEFFIPYGRVKGFENWDQLNNSGQLISLCDPKNNPVDQFNYSPSLITDTEKRKGGWSIELINPWQTCKGRLNWMASVDPSGGTPGTKNSIYNDEPDVIPPEITEVLWLNDETLKIKFTEPMDPVTSIQPHNFHMVPDNKINNIDLDSIEAKSISISFTEPVHLGILYELHISNIADCSSNPMLDTIIHTGKGKMPGFSDVLITELMIDEDPQVGLPDSEYIEILNNSDHLIDLSDLRFITVKDTFYTGPYLLRPGQYLMICPERKVPLYKNINNILGVSPFPALLNKGLTLGIMNAEKHIVSAVSYTDEWYRDLEKSSGGHSIEMIDISNPCGEDNNWRASDDISGGTPGRLNSVSESNPDLRAPYVSRGLALSRDTILIQFSERLHPDSPVRIIIDYPGKIVAGKFDFNSPVFNRVYVYPSDILLPGTEYQVSVIDAKDCVGNPISQSNNSITLQLPDIADSADLIINEILFNPKPLGVDWVEIYNKSPKYIKLNNFGLGRKEDPIEKIQRIHSELSILRPGEFVVITTDAESLLGDFPSGIAEKIIETTSFPSLPDQQGDLILYSDDDRIIDLMEYTSGYHHPLLKTDEGVSLERVSASASSLELSNWQSASSLAGYGTPTRKNSVDISLQASENSLIIENELFSPDGDNYLDELILNYQLAEPGYVANIDIYSLSGQKIVSLITGKIIGSTGSITWNGRDQNGTYAKPGYYIISMDLFDMMGNHSRIKKKCAIVYPY